MSRRGRHRYHPLLPLCTPPPPHCNSTRWPFQPPPIRPPSPAFPPPHGSSYVRTTHHQELKSSQRSHSAILRLFHLRNAHLLRLTLDDSWVSKKKSFYWFFFFSIRTVTPLSHPRDQRTSISRSWLLYLTLGTNTFQNIPRGGPASLRCTFGVEVLLVVFLRSTYLRYVWRVLFRVKATGLHTEFPFCLPVLVTCAKRERVSREGKEGERETVFITQLYRPMT